MKILSYYSLYIQTHNETLKSNYLFAQWEFQPLGMTAQNLLVQMTPLSLLHSLLINIQYVDMGGPSDSMVNRLCHKGNRELKIKFSIVAAFLHQNHRFSEHLE